jgi:multiple sugar transport system ATP-binding protein
MSSVVLENVSKSFKGPNGELVCAVNCLNLKIEPGELLVLVGPSGSGKTTLLRLIAGLEPPTSGQVVIDGKVINFSSPEERKVAMVFQEHALYPHMTAYENLAFGLKLRKVPKADSDRRVREVASQLGVTELLRRLPAQLSGGECQRVALGRAMIVQPGVFLLDEPLSNLDATLRLEMRREIAQLQSRLGMTMVYVTHDQAEAMMLADRLAVIRQGVVQQVGRPDEIYQKPANRFVAQFIGAPPMNFIPGRIVDEAGVSWFRSHGAPKREADRWAFPMAGQLASAAAACKSVALGLRPEQLRVIEGAGSAEESLKVLEAEVRACEPLGWETHLYMTAGDCEVVARVASGWKAKAGARVRVGFDTRTVHLFDADSGVNLGVGT